MIKTFSILVLLSVLLGGCSSYEQDSVVITFSEPQAPANSTELRTFFATQQRIIESQTIAKRVVQELGLAESSISELTNNVETYADPSSRTIRIRYLGKAHSKTPANIAAVFAKQYRIFHKPDSDGCRVALIPTTPDDPEAFTIDGGPNKYFKKAVTTNNAFSMRIVGISDANGIEIWPNKKIQSTGNPLRGSPAPDF